MAHIEYRKPLEMPGKPLGVSYLEHIDSRAGYIGPIRIPLKAALALITWEVRISHAWKRTFRPHLLHPEELTGYDGEPPYFLRADLAATSWHAVEYWLDQWMGPRQPRLPLDSPGAAADDMERLTELRSHLDPMEPYENMVIVWLVERPSQDPEHDDGVWYDATTRDAPGAVAYWRWDEA